MAASHIYLIEAENGRLKIGRSALVRDRVTAVRTHSPVRTRLIAMWLGGEAEEAELHRTYAPFRRHGEWFEISGDLAAFVRRVRGLNVPDIPSWDELRFEARASFQKRRTAVAREAARAAMLGAGAKAEASL